MNAMPQSQNINTNISSNINVIPDFKNSNSLGFIFLLVLVFIVCLILILSGVNIKSLFSVSMPNSTEQTVVNSFSILFIVLIIFGLSLIILPFFKDLNTLLSQLSTVTYLIIYTIFQIIFFATIPDTKLNTYADYIVPFFLLLTVFLFFRSYKINYVENFNLNYERIKSIIVFFCLLVTLTIYYYINPGGLMTKYFKLTAIVSILICVFTLLYLILVITMPNTSSNFTANLYSNLTTFTKLNIFGFLIFFITMIGVMYNYSGGFFSQDNKPTSIPALIVFFLICILWSIGISANLFSGFSNKNLDLSNLDIYKKTLFILFAIIVVGIMIAWFSGSIISLTGKSPTTQTIISVVLNIVLVILLLALIYKFFIVKLPQGNAKKDGFFNLIINLIFYIPCLFSNLFDIIGKFFVSGLGNTKIADPGSIIMLFVTLLIITIYFIYPYALNRFSLQGGEQLINKPVYLNSQYTLASYDQLNDSDNYNYQYSISSWIWIDAAAPNTNSNYNQYTSILNYGNKPNVTYNGKDNIFMITMKHNDLKDNTKNKLTEFDNNDDRIIYKNANFPLQKWNNLIINYDGGIMDIFLNGELVKSVNGVVPYYTLDNLTAGTNEGIEGGICNVIYFRKPLTTNNIYYLYNMAKNKTPPVLSDSNQTILQSNLNQVSNSEKSLVK